jgi:crotonobetainyl-CoA:carnitine CoA-transferase CaiB-like acyl-CoA transferase
MLTRSTADWIALLEDKAVPCGPINTIAQAFDDPQVKARGIQQSLPRNAGDGIGPSPPWPTPCACRPPR